MPVVWFRTHMGRGEREIRNHDTNIANIFVDCEGLYYKRKTDIIRKLKLNMNLAIKETPLKLAMVELP